MTTLISEFRCTEPEIVSWLHRKSGEIRVPPRQVRLEALQARDASRREQRERRARQNRPLLKRRRTSGHRSDLYIVIDKVQAQ